MCSRCHVFYIWCIYYAYIYIIVTIQVYHIFLLSLLLLVLLLLLLFIIHTLYLILETVSYAFYLLYRNHHGLFVGNLGSPTVRSNGFRRMGNPRGCKAKHAQTARVIHKLPIFLGGEQSIQIYGHFGWISLLKKCMVRVGNIMLPEKIQIQYMYIFIFKTHYQQMHVVRGKKRLWNVCFVPGYVVMIPISVCEFCQSRAKKKIYAKNLRLLQLCFLSFSYTFHLFSAV